MLVLTKAKEGPVCDETSVQCKHGRVVRCVVQAMYFLLGQAAASGSRLSQRKHHLVCSHSSLIRQAAINSMISSFTIPMHGAMSSQHPMIRPVSLRGIAAE